MTAANLCLEAVNIKAYTRKHSWSADIHQGTTVSLNCTFTQIHIEYGAVKNSGLLAQ